MGIGTGINVGLATKSSSETKFIVFHEVYMKSLPETLRQADFITHRDFTYLCYCALTNWAILHKACLLRNIEPYHPYELLQSWCTRIMLVLRADLVYSVLKNSCECWPVWVDEEMTSGLHVVALVCRIGLHMTPLLRRFAGFVIFRLASVKNHEPTKTYS